MFFSCRRQRTKCPPRGLTKDVWCNCIAVSNASVSVALFSPVGCCANRTGGSSICRASKAMVMPCVSIPYPNIPCGFAQPVIVIFLKYRHLTLCTYLLWREHWLMPTTMTTTHETYQQIWVAHSSCINWTNVIFNRPTEYRTLCV